MKYFACALVLAVSAVSFASGRHSSGHRIRSHVTRVRSGSHHRSSAGHYAGGHGSSHKGGHYKNKRTGNHYRKHR